MRIVAGRHRGRALAAPPGDTARPTADRAREALFNILTHQVSWPGLRVLDAFAGTGALGLEALSRGAEHATFIERHAASLTALRDNIKVLREEGRTTVIASDATKPPPAPAACGLIVMDPPYQSGLAAPCLSGLLAQGWIAPDAVIVVEVAAKEDFAAPDGFDIDDERRYGAARLIFLSLRQSPTGNG